MSDAPARMSPRPLPGPAPVTRRARLLGGGAFLAVLAAPATLTAPAVAQAPGFLPGMTAPSGVPVQPGTAPAPNAASALRGGNVTVDRNAPVTFTATEVEYDQNENRVTATGSVEAWQGERILRADRFTYDRDTGVATAEGNVQLLEPDGQVLFAERAVLQGGMKDAVVEGLRGLLAQNGRLAANGARRRTLEGGAVVMDLSRVVYSSCDLCAEDPEAAPIWQIRSRLATQDGEARRLRFRDATLDFAGVPSFYTPYMSVPDPSTPRSSGFLSPSFGQTRYLGYFTETPYYWAIDGQSDLTVTPSFQTEALPSAFASYRRRFNFGNLSIQGSVGSLTGRESSGEKGFGGHIAARGSFTVDENWTAGFNINRATSETYLRAYRHPGTGVLASTVYADGFWGYNTYARVAAYAFQSLRVQDDTGRIPVVLPTAYYETVFGRDSLGGTLTADAGLLNTYRDEGTKTRRASTRLSYELPRFDDFGAQWTFRARADGLAYNADDLNLAPNFANAGDVNSGNTSTAAGNIRLAVDWRLPLVRSAGSLGRQLIEPRVQVVTGPNTGRQRDIPNEDSLDFEFTDANLFSLNRFNGRDRQEGGTRVDAAMRGAWYFPNGGAIDAIAGRSFRASDEAIFEPRSGLEKRASDWVGRVTVSPTSWLDVTARTRLDGDTLDRRMIDVGGALGLAPVGLPGTRLTGGYLYEPPSPLRSPQRYVREVYAGVNTRLSTHWRANAFGRYDIELERGVSAGASLTYEDECFLLEGRFFRSFAINPLTSTTYPAGTIAIVRVVLKTLGDFSVRAL